MERATAFSPSLDKTKPPGHPQAWATHQPGFISLTGSSGALTPPPGSIAANIGLLNTRLTGVAGPHLGSDRGFRNGGLAGVNLFSAPGSGLLNNGLGGKHRNNSIESNKHVNRSKLLEDFRLVLPEGLMFIREP